MTVTFVIHIDVCLLGVTLSSFSNCDCLIDVSSLDFTHGKCSMALEMTSGVNPGGMGGYIPPPPPLFWVGGWPVQISPHFLKIR